MVSKCANPNCKAQFRYLKEGKLFQVETAKLAKSGDRGDKKPPHKIENFWLCDKCSVTLTVAIERHKGVVVVPIRKPFFQRASA
jgi:hypothetical protein